MYQSPVGWSKLVISFLSSPSSSYTKHPQLVATAESTFSFLAVKAFPHPLARLNAIKDTRMAGYRNYLSYMAVDEFTYTGEL